MVTDGVEDAVCGPTDLVRFPKPAPYEVVGTVPGLVRTRVHRGFTGERSALPGGRLPTLPDAARPAFGAACITSANALGTAVIARMAA